MTHAVWAAWLISLATWPIPILVLEITRSRSDRALWEIALDVPFAVALDLLTVLLAARFVPLETAALLSRPAWIVAGAIVATYRWRRRGWRPRFPVALRARDVTATLTSSALAIAAYSTVSFRYHNWDYGLHVPVVTSIASQRVPFINPLSGTQVLHYHFGGDVLSAILRTLSLDVTSSMRALHTGHDLMIAATAGTVTLLSIDLGLRRRWSAALGGLAVVLEGPIPLRGRLGHAFLGYAYDSFPALSYRPHAPLAGLLLVGALGVVAVRAARGGRVPTAATAPLLLAVFAVMGITDEASTGLLGLALGAAWLLDPGLLATRRWWGLFLLVGLGGAVIAANLVFGAALAPGSPVHSIALIAARVPPVLNPDKALPLSEAHGWRVFLTDYLPLLACGSALAMLAARQRSRGFVALAVATWFLIVVSAFLVLRVQVNHADNESQRFFVAPFFACVVLSVLFLDRMPRGSAMALLVLLGVAFPAVCSVVWLSEEAAPMAKEFDDDSALPGGGLHDLDCRLTADAHFGERPQAAYVQSTEYYRVSACRPIFNSGEGDWSTPTKPTTVPFEQLRRLDKYLFTPGEEARAICLRDQKAASDDVCKRALRVRTSCRPFGERYLICPLSASDRDALLGHKHE